MAYVSVTLRGQERDIHYRIVEDDPTTNAFETEWEFVAESKEFADSLTDEETAAVEAAVNKAASEDDRSDDYDDYVR